jgi:HK97 family phage major capsid protein/HK97 family phage prohead protease
VDRAYALIQFKALDAEQRILEGIASTPTPDRTGDVMDPAGASFALPLPLLWQHQKDKPIGHVLSARVTPGGIFVRAQIAKGVLPFIDEAWALLKAGLVRGLSVGWRPLDAPEPVTVAGKSAGLRYKRWELIELSTVTIPMNAETTILSVKSADVASRAALSGSPRRVTPAVAGPARVLAMSISEQVTAEKAALQTKSARFDELIQKDEDDGGLTDAEASERDALQKAIDETVTKIARLATMERAQALNATTLSMPAPRKLAASGYPRVEVVERKIEPWRLFARVAMATAVGKGSTSDTLAWAKRWDAETPEVSAYLKALPGTVTAGSPAWGSELAYPTNLASAFLELLAPRTIVGRITGFQGVPFNVRFTEQTGGSTVNWVGEAAAKPVGELAFTEHFLTRSKIAGIVVLSDELVRESSPSAEERVRNDLTKQISKFMDEQFITPGVTATANNPASVTNGAPTSAASGTTAAALRADLAEALGTFNAANLSTESLHIVTTEAVALNIAMMQNALGQPEFATMTPRGGTLLGFPVIASNTVPTGLIVYLLAGEIFLADDGRVTLDASNQATLDMAGGNSPTFNLWQKNCTGIRAERWIRWQKARAAAVYYHTGAAYTG